MKSSNRNTYLMIFIVFCIQCQKKNDEVSHDMQKKSINENVQKSDIKIDSLVELFKIVADEKNWENGVRRNQINKMLKSQKHNPFLASHSILNKDDLFLKDTIANIVVIDYLYWLNMLCNTNYRIIYPLKDKVDMCKVEEWQIMNLNDHEKLFRQKLNSSPISSENIDFLNDSIKATITRDGTEFLHKKVKYLKKNIIKNGLYYYNRDKIRKRLSALNDIKELEKIINKLGIDPVKEKKIFKQLLIKTQIEPYCFDVIKQLECNAMRQKLFHVYELDNDFDLEPLYKKAKFKDICFYISFGYNRNTEYLKQYFQSKDIFDKTDTYYFYTLPDRRVYRFEITKQNDKIELNKEIVNWMYFNPFYVYFCHPCCN